MFCILGWCHVHDFLRITNSNDHKSVLHRVWVIEIERKEMLLYCYIFILLYVYIVILEQCYGCAHIDIA